MTILEQYINDLTNSCSYLNQVVSDEGIDKNRINELIDGIEYQLGLPVVAESSEDLSTFNQTITDAKAYLSTL